MMVDGCSCLSINLDSAEISKSYPIGTRLQ